MCKAAHPSGGVVGSSNPRRRRGWRLHHYGGGVCCVFVLCVTVSSDCRHSLFVDKYQKKYTKVGIGIKKGATQACIIPRDLRL